MTMSKPPSGADWTEGYRAGLEMARALVIIAPTAQIGERFSGDPGGFPRVLDLAVNPDGDPTHVYNLYALRDAVLWWIDREHADPGVLQRENEARRASGNDRSQ